MRKEAPDTFQARPVTKSSGAPMAQAALTASPGTAFDNDFYHVQGHSIHDQRISD
jgi:hypothetical protein